MYKPSKATKTKLISNDGYKGESIEEKIQRILNNKEPISDGAPVIYTPRKDGVGAQYDIRTDRFELAVEGMDKVEKSYKARREEFAKKLDEANNPKNDGGAEPVAGTE